LAGALPAISLTGSTYTIGYPLIWGGAIYGKCDWNTGVQATWQFASSHRFYSYGQDLTNVNVPGLSLNWKGQSNAVNVSDIRLIFPGLGVILNNGVDGDQQCVVSAVFPDYQNPPAGYMTVFCANSDFSNPAELLRGVKTTIYTATTIKQEAYAISQF
jgi:hypothetical protein